MSEEIEFKNLSCSKLFEDDKDYHMCQSVVMVGGSSSGKSTKIHKMIEYASDHFDKIIIISSTGDIPTNPYKDKVPIVAVFDYYPPKVLSKIFLDCKSYSVNNEKEIEEGIKKRPKVMIVFDDIKDKITEIKNDKQFGMLFTMGRQYGIKVILSVHAWTDIPVPIRTNISFIMFLDVKTDNIYDNIYKNFWNRNLGDKKNMRKIIQAIIKEKGSALVINNIMGGANDITKIIHKFYLTNEEVQELKNKKFICGNFNYWLAYFLCYKPSWKIDMINRESENIYADEKKYIVE